MKGTLGIPVTTILDGPIAVFTGTEGLTTLVLRDIEIGKVKFGDKIGAVGMFETGTLTCKGYTPWNGMDDVGV